MTTTQKTATTPLEAAATGEWVLDPQTTTVGLRTRSMWGLLPVRGTFAVTGGHARVTAGGGVRGHVEVDAASISTGMRIRDGHLRGGQFFDVDAHPSLTVDIDRVEPAERPDTAGGTTAVGVLHAEGRSVPVRFAVTVTCSSEDQVEAEAQLDVDRSLVGITTRANGATTMDDRIAVHACFHPV